MSYEIHDMPPVIAASRLKELTQVETATVGHTRWRGFMHRQIAPLLSGRRIAGTAVTLAIPGSDSTLLHHALGLLRPGDVLVVDRLGDDRYACWGGAVTIAAKAAGAVAGIVDGPCTDVAEIRDSDFPMWCRGIAPITTRLNDLGGALNIPVSCGGTVVMPGDAILADDSGVLVIPPDELAAVVAAALERQTNGQAREKRVAQGEKLGALSGASAKVLAKVGLS